MKKLNQNQEIEAEILPKRMKTSNMDQFEATNYHPIISNVEIASAKLELDMAPKDLDFNGLKNLCLNTRLYQRKMIQDPIKGKITEQFSMFPWLKEVCITLLHCKYLLSDY